MDDILYGSDDSDSISSDDEIPSIDDIPDTITYRWPKNILEVIEPESLETSGLKKLRKFFPICEKKVDEFFQN